MLAAARSGRSAAQSVRCADGCLGQPAEPVTQHGQASAAALQLCAEPVDDLAGVPEDQRQGSFVREQQQLSALLRYGSGPTPSRRSSASGRLELPVGNVREPPIWLVMRPCTAWLAGRQFSAEHADLLAGQVLPSGRPRTCRTPGRDPVCVSQCVRAGSGRMVVAARRIMRTGAAGGVSQPTPTVADRRLPAKGRGRHRDTRSPCSPCWPETRPTEPRRGGLEVGDART
jgi:hypothetical protein